MEMIQAYKERKTILVFADSTVKAEYFSKAKDIIENYIELHKRDN